MLPLYDSHAHYNDEKFDSLEGGASALLSSLHEEGVAFVCNAATSIPSCKEVLAFATAPWGSIPRTAARATALKGTF